MHKGGLWTGELGGRKSGLVCCWGYLLKKGTTDELAKKQHGNKDDGRDTAEPVSGPAGHILVSL